MLRVALVAVVSLAQAATAQVVAVTGASVISMDGDGVLASHTVIVRDGVIAAVGPDEFIAVPEGAAVVDGSGLFVIPGLGDMHVHFNSPHDALLNVANGVTVVRNMWGMPMHVQLREQGRVMPDAWTGDSESWPVPTIVTAGALIDGEPAIWDGSASVGNAEDAAAEVRAQAEAGFDFIKTYSNLSAEAYGAIVEAADEAGIPFGGHVPQRVGVEAAYSAGQWSNEHLTEYLAGAQRDDSPWRVAVEAGERMNYYERMIKQREGLDRDRLAELGRLSRSRKVWEVPTLIVTKRTFASPTTKAELLKWDWMKYISAGMRGFWNPANDFRLRDVPAETLEAVEAGFVTELEMAGILYDAGAELVVGTDAPNPFVFPGFSVHEELELFVEAGLSPYRALRAATVQPSRMLGQKGEFGRVAPGHRGDLVLLRANPLEDILNTREIEGVVLRGRFFDRDDLNGMLEAAAAFAAEN